MRKSGLPGLTHSLLDYVIITQILNFFKIFRKFLNEIFSQNFGFLCLHQDFFF